MIQSVRDVNRKIIIVRTRMNGIRLIKQIMLLKYCRYPGVYKVIGFYLPLDVYSAISRIQTPKQGSFHRSNYIA